MASELDYAARLRVVRDMEEGDMRKVKKLFAVMGPAINQAIIKRLCEQRLIGKNWLWRENLNEYVVDKYSFKQPHVSIALNRMLKQQILIKRRDADNKRYVHYSLSPEFKQITQALLNIMPILHNIQNED